MFLNQNNQEVLIFFQIFFNKTTAAGLVSNLQTPSRTSSTRVRLGVWRFETTAGPSYTKGEGIWWMMETKQKRAGVRSCEPFCLPGWSEREGGRYGKVRDCIVPIKLDLNRRSFFFIGLGFFLDQPRSFFLIDNYFFLDQPRNICWSTMHFFKVQKKFLKSLKKVFKKGFKKFLIKLKKF